MLPPNGSLVKIMGILLYVLQLPNIKKKKKLLSLGGTNPQVPAAPDVGTFQGHGSTDLLCSGSLHHLSSVCDGQTPTWNIDLNIVQFQILK